MYIQNQYTEYRAWRHGSSVHSVYCPYRGCLVPRIKLGIWKLLGTSASEEWKASGSLRLLHSHLQTYFHFSITLSNKHVLCGNEVASHFILLKCLCGCVLTFKKSMTTLAAGEMSWWIRALLLLPETQHWFPAFAWWLPTIQDSSFRRSESEVTMHSYGAHTSI